MIWYLLYPLRGTTDPARLHDDHYIRKAISYLGTVVAQHSALTIIITVAIGISLSLPVPFLYSPASSVNYLKPPNHVWISAESFANGEALVPDISIKQAWIHGSWMKALERETLLEAIAVQDMLLGPMLSYHSEPDVATSFLHSPLMYWNCSVAAIESDNSILTTINNRAHDVSPSKITLRPSSVLSGVLSSYNNLIAADALVVSLFYEAKSRAGDLWDQGAASLAQHDPSRWEVYPADGRRAGSRLYRFQSRLISVQDKAVFFGSYGLVLLYVVFSLRNIRTLKSRVGLFMTIVLQECFSILSGFTLAKFLHIDVFSIPPQAYPFVVLVIGLENMFRLVDEVENSPLEDQSVPRVATALGAVGHLSLVAVAQNLVILGLISRVAPPGLAAFCGFASISLTVDLVFFFTFFVSTLSLDLRQYGLQDSFEDIRKRYDAQSTKTFRGNGPAQQQQEEIMRRPRHTTFHCPRALGTIVVVLFLFMLGSHFIQGWTSFYWARNFTLISDWSDSKTTRDHLRGFNSTVEQTRNSVNWLQSQEYQTAREILDVFNPGSHGFVVRIYNPLVVVLNSADRSPSPAEAIIFGPVWLSVTLFCGTAALILTLWNYLSSNDAPDEAGNGISKPAIFSSVQCLPRGHSLDVFILGASSKCVLASVGFDHEIRVWHLESRIIRSQPVPPSQQHTFWPVATTAIDDSAEWLAICSKSGEVNFWNIQSQCLGRTTTINLDAPIITCFFTSYPKHDGLHSATRFLLVSASGCLSEVEVETANVTSHQICAHRVQSSHVNSHRLNPLRLITISEDNKIYVTAKRENCWNSHAFEFSLPILNQPSRLRFTIIPDLRMVALVFNIDTCQLYLIDLLSGVAIYTFRPRPFNHQTLRAIHSPPQQCLSCGAVALISFSIAYSEEQDGSFTMVTLSAERNPRLRTGMICLRAERDVRERRCIGFEGCTEKTFSMQHAGVWEATRANGVAGVRHKGQDPQMMFETFTRNNTLFRRKAELTRKDRKIDEEAWEAWTMTATGIVNIHTLKVGLFTDRAGPMCSVGRNAIAVGLEEDIVLIQFGSQLHDDDDGDDTAVRKPPRPRLVGRSIP